MESSLPYLAYFTVRVFLGILLLAQGYDRIFMVGIKKVVYSFEQELAGLFINRVLLTIATVFTSWIEFIAGIMLVLGIFTIPAFYLISIDLLVVGLSFSIIKPMWDMQFVFPRLVLLIILELLPFEWNVFSIDYLLTR